MSKKVSYIKLLKEAVGEFTDNSKSVDVTGPMTEPIISYDGGGELPTHKDAASILERYYFKENEEPMVELTEDETGAGKEPDEHTPIEVDAQKSSVDQTKKDIEKAVASDESSVTEQDDQGEGTQAAGTGGDESELTDKGKEAEKPTDGAPTVEQEAPAEEEEEKEEEAVEESVENAVIEKLIAEMEEEEKEEEKEELDVDKEVATEQEAPAEKEEEEEEAVVEAELPASPDAMKDEEEDALEEAFQLFREQIEEDEVTE